MTPAGKRYAVLLTLLVAVAAAAFWPRSESAPGASAVAASPTRPGTRTPAAQSAADLPMMDLSIGRGETVGTVTRNVFRFYEKPTPIPPTPRPTPTPLPVQGSRDFIGPVLPTPTPTPTPIVPPPIPYKAVGLFGPRERMIAALEEGGRLISAREGDVLDGRFILKRINRESIDFAFVGLPPEITRRIPLAGTGSGR